MSDYISRESAIESIATALMQMDDPDAPRRTVEDYMPLAESMIRGVPAAPVREAKRGRWIYLKERKYKRGGRNSDHKKEFGTEWRTELSQKCSCCGMTTMLDASIAYKYCPHCGADMREEE